MTEIATPGLSFVGELSAAVGPPLDVGTTPHGIRRIVPILTGEMTGPRLAGKLLPGGTDYQVWRRDGVTEIHARYVIEGQSGARLYVEASERAPGNHELLFWAGLGMAQAGDFDAGVARVRDAIALQPTWRELLSRLPSDLAPAAPSVLSRLGTAGD